MGDPITLRKKAAPGGDFLKSVQTPAAEGRVVQRGVECLKPQSGTFERKTAGGEAYPIENLNDCEGLLLSHPQKCIISVFKHAAELLDVSLRARIEFSESFERGDIRGSLLQRMNECRC